jgi:hypothetical protein
MTSLMRCGAILIPLAMLAACASNTGGWQGADPERVYDKALDAARLTQVINNDDYYEIHKDGKIYVLADAADLKTFLANGDIPLRVTRIGGGPSGETVVFDIARPESAKKEGFGSVEMYDGRRPGAEKDFYAEVHKDGKYYVFGSWAALEAFRKSGDLSGLTTAQGPGGEALMVAQPAETLVARFKSLRGAP